MLVRLRISSWTCKISRFLTFFFFFFPYETLFVGITWISAIELFINLSSIFPSNSHTKFTKQTFYLMPVFFPATFECCTRSVVTITSYVQFFGKIYYNSYLNKSTQSMVILTLCLMCTSGLHNMFMRMKYKFLERNQNNGMYFKTR